MGRTLIQRAPGTRDFYPDDMRLRTWLFGKMRDVAARFGYEEYDGPLLEPYELFAAKSGSQLVGDEMYTLVDRGGRRLGIRPEMTPTLARMVAQRQRQLPKPVRWFAIPACWRYERPQKGRVREHWQWNVDLLGVPGVAAEAEVIAVFATFLQEVGLTDRDFRVRIGHRAWLAERLDQIGMAPRAHLEVLRAIDRREKRPADAFDASLREAGLDSRQRVTLTALLDGRDFDDYGPLVDLFRVLDCYGLSGYCEFDPSVVRGLAYYTSTVYEIWDRRRDFRAIAGGGRYDDLTVALGGDPLPGVGMAMGDVVLTLLLQREGKLPDTPRRVDAYVAAYSAAERDEAIRVAQALRRAGLSADLSLQSDSLGRQLRRAEAAGARHTIIVAPDELARGEAVVRDMASGDQAIVPLGEIVGAVRRVRESRRARRDGASGNAI